MPFIIFRTRSHKSSQLPLLGQFLSRHWFMLCITIEAELRIAKQYKCHYCCVCKNYRGKAMEDGKTVSLHHFPADQMIVNAWEKCILGHPITQATSCCQTHSLRTFKNTLKVGTVNFVNPLPPPSIVKKVHIGSKKQPEDLSDAG